MFRNYLLVAYRNLIRNKMFSTINIAGLALGMTATLFLFSYVSFELSYDKFHDRLKDIYMIRMDSYKGNGLEGSSMASFYAETPAIKELYPQVENYVRFHTANGMITYQPSNGENVSYFERDGYYADSSFFSVFSFPLIAGDKNLVLKNANSMLMSESAAKKYFGNEDPIGKVIKLTTEWEGGDYVVEGVFEDVPENSHVRFDFLFAIEKLLNNKQFKYNGWYWENFNSYLLLKPNADPAKLEAGMDKIVDANIGAELKNTNSAKKLVLVPLADVHLYSTVAYVANGNYQTVYLIFIVACLVLGIAWLNYLNLSTAAAFQRSKEVGVRKVMGSERAQLVRQFLVESFFVSTIAILITALLLIVLNAYFTDLVHKQIVVDLVTQGTFWLIVVGSIAVGIFLCGFYPGVILSSFQPFAALKGTQLKGSKGERTRKVMVVFQFVASISMIAATLTIREQVTFMRNQQAGIDIRQKLILRSPKIVTGESRLNEINAFKNLLRQHPSIKNVASSSEVPGHSVSWAKEFKLVQQTDEQKQVLHVLSVDEDFINAYGLTLVAGRNFSENHPSDFGGVVLINEAALRRLGIKDAESAINQQLTEFSPQRIIGVVKDYQQQSFKQANIPIVFEYIPWNNDYLTISLVSQNLRADVDLVTAAYKKTFPGNAVEYYFLDDFMGQLYKSDEQFWNIFRVFSVLTIFISCLGLFGLSSHVISKRTKEVGIRKVLGGSVLSIVQLLSFDFLKLVIIAFVLAVPLITIVMNQWLETFASRISIPVWIYLTSGIIAMLIATITISWQAIKAATAAPVNAIRIE
jgi:putative ABC transport system permease protein